MWGRSARSSFWSPNWWILPWRSFFSDTDRDDACRLGKGRRKVDSESVDLNHNAVEVVVDWIGVGCWERKACGKVSKPEHD